MLSLLYDYVAKFETEITVSVLPKELTDMFLALCEHIPVEKQIIKTTVTASAAPLITDDNKEKFCRTQNEAYKEGLESADFQNKLGYAVTVGKTRFMGYESISEHNENERSFV